MQGKKLYLLAFLFLLHTGLCFAEEFTPRKEMDLSRLNEIADKVIFGDNLDEMLETSRQLYNDGLEQCSDPMMIYGTTLLGICHLYSYNIDSCIYYLNNSLLLDEKNVRDGGISCNWAVTTALNNLGLCYINLVVDYYKASEYFLRALELTDKTSNYNMYMTLLANLSITHYFKNDPSGIEFARECLELSRQHHTKTSMAYYAAAIMEYTNRNYKEAEKNAKLLISELSKEDTLSPSIIREMLQANIIYGKIELELGKEKEAVSAFEKAIKTDNAPEYLRADYAGAFSAYSDYFIRKKQYDKALETLFKALELSIDGQNLVHLNSLYNKISEVYELTGNTGKALEYAKKEKQVNANIFTASKEYALSEIKARYQLEQYENFLKERQINALKQTKMKQLYIGVSIIILILFFSLLQYLYSKNKYYRNIVNRYKENLALSKYIKENDRYEKSSLSETKGNDIFSNLQRLMSEDKLYRDGEITLDKLASLLGTNRSYLSRVINEQTGMNFNKYINKHRIEEAVEILSDKTACNRTLKSIGYDLGFHSPSMFYKCFSDETGISPSSFRQRMLSL